MNHRLLLPFCFAILLVGCGGPAKPLSVKGTVKLDGKPMADGEVSFGLPGEAPSTLTVTNGAFTGTAKIGNNKVEVRAYRPGKVTIMDKEKLGGDKENYLPAKWNAESKLEADVKSGAANEFNFDVTSK